MQATSVYPNWPPVVTTTGLAGSLAASDPDSVPLAPQSINDTRRRYTGSGVDAHGVLQLHKRNVVAYPYLRAHKRMKMVSFAHLDRAAYNVQMQALHYLKTYPHFVPSDILQSHLEEVFESDHQPISHPKWQGNSLAGTCTSAGDHIVFFPTGEVLQQACAFYNTHDLDSQGYFSNTIETGTTIRQFAVMGRNSASNTGQEDIFVAARGSAACTILQAPLLPGSKMIPKLKLTFAEMLYNIAASPHAEAELAFVTADGKIHWWEPESGLQTKHIESATTSDYLVRCEYSSHPCVLWTANRFTMRSVDLREKVKPLAQYDTLFDLAGAGAASPEIYDIKRRASSPFQFIVGSGVSIEIFDSRMPGQPLISWAQHTGSADSQSRFGLIDELDLSSSAKEERGAIVSTSHRNKVTTIYPFERCRKGDKTKSMSLLPLRSIHDDSSFKSTDVSQYVNSDAPLDLRLMDGDEWSALIGITPLPMPSGSKRGKAATIYQMNNLGDLFSQKIHTKGRDTPYDAAVQVDLPCGVTAVGTTDPKKRKRLPMPADSILPEHDSNALAPYVPIALKAMRRKYPRVLTASESKEDDESGPTMDGDVLIATLLSVCRPSATLFRLHRYVNDTMKFPIAAQDLLGFLRSQNDKFQIRSVYTPVRQKTMHVLNPHGLQEQPIHELGDDPRIAVCKCCPKSATSPCDSLACIIPHALVISSVNGLRLNEIFPPRRESNSDFAVAIAEARDMYGIDEM